MKRTYRIVVGVLTIIFVFLVGMLISYKEQTTNVACTAEAKLCPDGSAVGRIGARCEFTPCPVIKPKIDTIAPLTEKITKNGISVTPLEVVEDSRCPLGVMCVQAGGVRLSVELESEGNTKNVILASNEPVTFYGRRVSFSNVAPNPYAGIPIGNDQYRFEFIIEGGR